MSPSTKFSAAAATAATAPAEQDAGGAAVSAAPAATPAAAPAAAHAAAPGEVVVYTQPGCQQCIATKRTLESAGVPHRLEDVSLSESARARVAELGYRSLPVVETADAHWSGFRPDRLAALPAALQPV